MDEQLIALFHQHVGTAFDRRLRLAALVEQKAAGAKWAYDVAAATLSFGKLAFEAPLLGSHAQGNDSWLWAWANRNLKLTLTNRAIGDLVRVTAHRLTVPMLAHPGFSVEPLLGPALTKHAADVFGCVLANELGYDAHYVTVEPGHRSVILVRDPRLAAAERYPLHRVLTVFPKVVRALPVSDLRAALAAYARDCGLTVSEEPDALKITDGKGVVAATFDEHGALKKLIGDGVAAPPEKKPAPAKAVAVKKAVAKSAAKKVVAKKVAKPAAKVVKAVPKKPVNPAAKKPVAKKPVAKKAAAKKVVAKRPVSKVAPKAAAKGSAKKR